MKIRDVIKLLEEDGWVLARTKGSHRQFKHPTKKGTVTVAGKQGHDLAPGTLNSVLKQAQLKQRKHVMEYAVVIEQGEGNFSAYVPDLPGCVAAGETEEEVLEMIRAGIELHLKAMREDGESIPAPGTHIRYVEVKSAA